MAGRGVERRLERAARGVLLSLGLLAAVGGLQRQAGAAAPDPWGFTNFETEPVRPLALSPDGRRLFALNTADDRLEVFDVEAGGITRRGEVAVGLRPVALAVRTAGEVWVTNHLSDSVSVVDVSDPTVPKVVRTLPVGDEPRDIVVAGPDRTRVFVATAHRADATKPGVGRADVWVFDALQPAAAPQVVRLFGTKPRGLAVSPDGARVFAAIFHSGNGTTSIDERTVAGSDPRVEPPVPPSRPTATAAAPPSSVPPPTPSHPPSPTPLPTPTLVAFGAGLLARFGLPAGQPPTETLAPTATEGGPEATATEGTTEATPANDTPTATPSEASPTPGLRPSVTPSGPTPTPPGGIEPPPVGVIVRADGARWVDEVGRDWSAAVAFSLPDYDVFVIDAGAARPAVVGAARGVGTVLFNLAVQPGTGEVWVTNTEARNFVRFEPRLKGGAVLSRLTRLIPTGETNTYEVRPQDLNSHIDRDGPVGVAAEIERSLSQPVDLVFNADGSRAYVAVFGSRKVAVLDAQGAVLDRIDVGFGPGGVVLDEAHDRLIVLNHLEATISLVDLATHEGRTVPLAFDPTPPEVHAGRPFLYDAAETSGHGDQSCGSCHVFADLDGLAWDLGDPTGEMSRMPFDITHENFVLKPRDFRFHPLKGPMITQSLRGMAGAGPMHWRGDRFGAEGPPGDERASFMAFRPAFESLLGRETRISETQMTAFGEFVLGIHYPPNPNQALDRRLSPAAQAGADFFSGDFPSDSGISNCAGCHTLPLGTNGLVNFEGDRSGQDFKVPHLRAIYEKVGRFNQPGEQVSGFGLGHDGSVDTAHTLLSTELFEFPGADEGQRDVVRARLEAFLLSFDTGMAPAVGRQLTLAAPPTSAERELLTTLQSRAAAGDCDLVARGRDGATGEPLGWLLTGRAYRPNRAQRPWPSPDELLAAAPGASGPLTFTCVPPGDGVRSAIDRDRDGHLDGDERDAGTDPADASRRPRPVAVVYLPHSVK